MTRERHGHVLHEVGARPANVADDFSASVVYPDGCRDDPNPDGSWTFTPRFDYDGVLRGLPDCLDPDPLTVSEPLVRLRAQPRSGCLGWLIAIAFGMLFWAAVGGIVVHVVAAPRSAPVQPAQSGAPPASVAQLVEHRPDAARSLGSEVAGSNPAHWGGAPLSALTYTGKLGYALPSYGPRYLAIRWPRGTVATLCGPVNCVTRVSTDFGPVRSLWEKGRLADLSAVDWQRVCGQPLRFGLCQGTLLIVSRPRALPETATE